MPKRHFFIKNGHKITKKIPHVQINVGLNFILPYALGSMAQKADSGYSLCGKTMSKVTLVSLPMNRIMKS